MQVLREGHKYLLENFEKPEGLQSSDSNNPYSGQILQFIEKFPVTNDPRDARYGELETIHNGTTNEEVLEVLIDRMNYLQKKFSCRENSIAITHLETALLWLKKRTEDRKKRGVEGKAKD